MLATKVDPDSTTGDFSGAQVRRSAEGSLRRLGVDRLQLVYLHDPEVISFEEGMAPGGPVEALIRLQQQGLIEHLGVAGGPVELMARYLRTGAFEVLITHNRWTLVDRSADGLLDVIVFNPPNLAATTEIASRIAIGQVDRSHYVRQYTGKHVRIESDPSAPVECDGDVIGSTPVAMRIVPVVLPGLGTPASAAL